MSVGTSGLHHVTAISGEPQATVDFYAGVLGLRLVKRTVNFDDPFTYHLYFGDERGSPGTIVTFFPWPGAGRGRGGNGQVNVISLAVPRNSLGWWLERLISKGVAHEGPVRRFGDQVLTLKDQDGIALELVACAPAAPGGAWGRGSVPADHAIRGVHGVTLWEEALAPTAEFLTGVMGFRAAGSEGSIHRFEGGSGGAGTIADVRVASGFWSAAMGVGTVHHVAWRTGNDATQLAARGALMEAGIPVTPVKDRQYFKSIYFHEPGGVLFEIATDAPGFATDEPLETLGTMLKLPPWLEAQRDAIAKKLPAFHSP